MKAISGAANYNAGKAQEKEADIYIRDHGLARPSPQHRKVIQRTLEERENISIRTRGYDLVDEHMIPHCESVESLTPMLDKLVLYEMKSAGSARKSALKEGWQGLGFTYSSNEDKNWELLGDARYKFVFVDLRSTPSRHLILTKDQWTENARIIPTYSVFINNSLFS
jgi:hypothetical protein